MIAGTLTRSRIRTWADGFGCWHAAVPGDLADPRRAARDAIRRELEARGDIQRGYVLRVERAPAHWHTTLNPDDRPVFKEAATR